MDTGDMNKLNNRPILDFCCTVHTVEGFVNA